MREIKFRAWNPKLKKWIPWASWGEATDHWATGYEDGIFALHGHEDLCVYSQYTGLKDKNGVEVAIGDIVQDKDLEKEPYLVEEGDGMITAGGIWLNSFRASLVEIIGNIYEHPELLTPQP